MKKIPGKGRTTRPVNLTLRPATIAAVKAAAAAEYLSLSRYVDRVVARQINRRTYRARAKVLDV